MMQANSTDNEALKAELKDLLKTILLYMGIPMIAGLSLIMLLYVGMM